MRIGRRLATLLPVEAHEWIAVRLLIAYSVGIGIFGAFYFSLANARFLAAFPRDQVPLAYVAGGVLGYAVMRFYRRLAGRVAFTRLLYSTLLVQFLVLCLFAFFRLLSTAFRAGLEQNWGTFAMFMAIGPMLGLMDHGFWGLADRLFDLQQGKRLNGLIASGEALSAVVALVLVPFLMADFSEYFLVLAAAGVAGCALVLRSMSRRFPAQLEGEKTGDPAAPEGTAEEAGAGGYFWLIALVMALFVLTHYFVDFAFLSSIKHQAKDDPVRIGSFIGVFFAAVRLAELVGKLKLSSWLVQSYGLAAGLFILPAAVLLCAVPAVLVGLVAGTEALLFFVLVLLAKLLTLVLRRAVFEPSFKVLYQPLPTAHRFRVRTRVDGEIRYAVTVLSGLALLAFAAAEDSATLVVVLVVGILFAWVAASKPLLEKYRSRLEASLRALPKTSIVDAPEEILRARLLSATPLEASFSLNVLEHLDPVLYRDLVRTLLSAETPSLRMEALGRVASQRLFEARGDVARLQDTAETTWEEVRQAFEALERSAERPSAELLQQMVRSKSAKKRRSAAWHLARGDGPDTSDLMQRLLRDSDPRVRQAAIVAAGRLGRPEFWLRIIDQLQDGEMARTVSSSLQEIGPPILDRLEVAFRRFSDSQVARMHILRVFERIGGEKASQQLFDKIDYPDHEVRRQTLRSLGVLGFRARESQVAAVKRQITETVDRLTWNVRAKLDLGGAKQAAELSVGLTREIGRQREALFLLLALICEPQAIRLMQRHIDAETPRDRAIALEIADQVVPEVLKKRVLPVLRLPPDGRLLNRLALAFPQSSMSLQERLRDILRQGYVRVDPWNRACAIDALVRLEPEPVPDELFACLFHPHPMVRETAACGLDELDPRGLRARLGQSGEDRWQIPGLLAFERTLILSRTPLFSKVPKRLLAKMAMSTRVRTEEAGTTLFGEGDAGNFFFVIVSGRVRIEKDETVLAHLGGGELLGEIAAVETGVRVATAIVEDEAQLLKLDRATIHDLIAQHVEIMPGIIEVIAQRRSEIADAP